MFGAGSAYVSLISNLDHLAERAIESFFDQHQSEKYLLTELQSNLGILRSLRNELMIWANQYYDLGSEDFDAMGEPDDMDQRISEDFNKPPASIGGNLTPAATVLLMEKLASSLKKSKATPPLSLKFGFHIQSFMRLEVITEAKAGSENILTFFKVQS